MKNKRVAVILGGLSKERDVSLRSGEAVYKALVVKGYQVMKFDPKTDDFNDLKTKTDVAFVVLHGRYGEDGCLQGLLESFKIPYTGSGVTSSALCFSKILTKLFLKNIHVVMPKDWIVTASDNIPEVIAKNKFALPVIVKPNREGSTIGMSIVRDQKDLAKAIKNALEYDDEILVEEFIKGTEVTVSVLNGKALPPVEIAPKSGFYDYESKYTVGKTEYFVPARIDKKVADHLVKISERIVKEMGCRGTPRIDYIINDKGEAYFLEVNTIPGMTETSLLPKAAQAVGLGFAELCEEILASAKLNV
jgi:D-alanine--D-alanine ligase